MYLHGLATANPPRSRTQAECLELARSAYDTLPGFDRRARLMLSSILRSDSGVETRQFAVRDISRLFQLDADELNGEFRATAPALAAAAIERGARMQATGVAPATPQDGQPPNRVFVCFVTRRVAA